MNRIKLIGVLVVGALLLAGCAASTKKPADEAAGDPSAMSGAGTDPGAADGAGVGADGRMPGDPGAPDVIPLGPDGSPLHAEPLPGGMGDDPFNDPANPLSRRVIYFAFDSYSVPAESVPVVEAHGQYLAANPHLRARLEGHTDERGTREYNIGLGDRRAQAVRRMLQLHGVGPAQMEVVSFGEELPAVLGSHEEAWRLNRRVEIVYEGRN
ncbi:MAG: peptidoglycan-associated lipoprotein Pal [Chromatiales bacterium]|jgi:peptidoglycan-associated lipoprotein|nr:peptidoglycan-associated lipoprotein Pal [Chromatiales bacterium]MDX9766481.1 peptidoglycan-associated lipoprotein Pal [Ectothiorhodospiraceae bacterium]